MHDVCLLILCFDDLYRFCILYLDELLQHPCLEVLEKEIDVRHTCGYINLLRTGAPPQQKRTRDHSASSSSRKQQPSAEEKAKQSEISNFLEDLKELGIDEPKTPTATKEVSSTQEGAAASSDEQKLPQNGTGTAPVSHSNDGKESDGVYCEESMSPLQKKLLEEWLPLELSFGIPLFSDDANHTVCDKVHTRHMQIM